MSLKLMGGISLKAKDEKGGISATIREKCSNSWKHSKLKLLLGQRLTVCIVQLHEAEARSSAAAGAGGANFVGGSGVHWISTGIRATGQEGQVDGPVPPLSAGLVGGIHAVIYAVT